MFVNQLKKPLSDVCLYILAVGGGGGNPDNPANARPKVNASQKV